MLPSSLLISDSNFSHARVKGKQLAVHRPVPLAEEGLCKLVKEARLNDSRYFRRETSELQERFGVFNPIYERKIQLSEFHPVGSKTPETMVSLSSSPLKMKLFVSLW